MSSFGGIRIIQHPLLEGMRFARLKLSPDVPLNDGFRAEFDAWLLEQFGSYEAAFVVSGGRSNWIDPTKEIGPYKAAAYVSPKHMVMIKLEGDRP